ncbi:hypothetical protein, partial [Actinacidiphila oryziradicis]
MAMVSAQTANAEAIAKQWGALGDYLQNMMLQARGDVTSWQWESQAGMWAADTFGATGGIADIVQSAANTCWKVQEAILNFVAQEQAEAAQLNKSLLIELLTTVLGLVLTPVLGEISGILGGLLDEVLNLAGNLIAKIAEITPAMSAVGQAIGFVSETGLAVADAMAGDLFTQWLGTVVTGTPFTSQNINWGAEGMVAGLGGAAGVLGAAGKLGGGDHAAPVPGPEGVGGVPEPTPAPKVEGGFQPVNVTGVNGPGVHIPLLGDLKGLSPIAHPDSVVSGPIKLGDPSATPALVKEGPGGSATHTDAGAYTPPDAAGVTTAHPPTDTGVPGPFRPQQLTPGEGPVASGAGGGGAGGHVTDTSASQVPVRGGSGDGGLVDTGVPGPSRPQQLTPGDSPVAGGEHGVAPAPGSAAHGPGGTGAAPAETSTAPRPSSTSTPKANLDSAPHGYGEGSAAPSAGKSDAGAVGSGASSDVAGVAGHGGAISEVDPSLAGGGGPVGHEATVTPAGRGDMSVSTSAGDTGPGSAGAAPSREVLKGTWLPENKGVSAADRAAQMQELAGRGRGPLADAGKGKEGVGSASGGGASVVDSVPVYSGESRAALHQELAGRGRGPLADAGKGKEGVGSASGGGASVVDSVPVYSGESRAALHQELAGRGR